MWRCLCSAEQGAGPRRRTLGDDRGVIRCGYEQVLELHKRRCVAFHTCNDMICMGRLLTTLAAAHVRYLLRECALEIFSSDGRDHLLVFTAAERNKVYTKLTQITSGKACWRWASSAQLQGSHVVCAPLGAVSSSKRILESGGAALGLIGVGTQDETLGAGGGFFSQLWGEKSATQRWVNGEMTNFEVCAVWLFPIGLM